MSDFLEPCPFCGKQDTLEVEDNIEGRAFQGRVVCNIHWGGCGASSGWRSNVTDTILAWNLRTE